MDSTCTKSNISSANLRSRSFGKPSCRSPPHCAGHRLHEWNARVLECAEQAGVKLWSRRCLEQHWKLANYIANLSENRWLKRTRAWTAGRRTRIGKPTNTWDAWQNLGEWWATAMQTDFWLTHMDSFHCHRHFYEPSFVPVRRSGGQFRRCPSIFCKQYRLSRWRRLPIEQCLQHTCEIICRWLLGNPAANKSVIHSLQRFPVNHASKLQS